MRHVRRLYGFLLAVLVLGAAPPEDNDLYVPDGRVDVRFDPVLTDTLGGSERASVFVDVMVVSKTNPNGARIVFLQEWPPGSAPSRPNIIPLPAAKDSFYQFCAYALSDSGAVSKMFVCPTWVYVEEDPNGEVTSGIPTVTTPGVQEPGQPGSTVSGHGC